MFYRNFQFGMLGCLVSFFVSVGSAHAQPSMRNLVRNPKDFNIQTLNRLTGLKWQIGVKYFTAGIKNLPPENVLRAKALLLELSRQGAFSHLQFQSDEILCSGGDEAKLRDLDPEEIHKNIRSLVKKLDRGVGTKFWTPLLEVDRILLDSSNLKRIRRLENRGAIKVESTDRVLSIKQYDKDLLEKFDPKETENPQMAALSLKRLTFSEWDHTLKISTERPDFSRIVKYLESLREAKLIEFVQDSRTLEITSYNLEELEEYDEESLPVRVWEVLNFLSINTPRCQWTWNGSQYLTATNPGCEEDFKKMNDDLVFFYKQSYLKEVISLNKVQIEKILEWRYQSTENRIAEINEEFAKKFEKFTEAQGIKTEKFTEKVSWQWLLNERSVQGDRTPIGQVTLDTQREIFVKDLLRFGVARGDLRWRLSEIDLEKLKKFDPIQANSDRIRMMGFIRKLSGEKTIPPGLSLWATSLSQQVVSAPLISTLSFLNTDGAIQSTQLSYAYSIYRFDLDRVEKVSESVELFRKIRDKVLSRVPLFAEEHTEMINACKDLDIVQALSYFDTNAKEFCEEFIVKNSVTPI